MQKKGWYVYKVGGRLPQYCHRSFDAAVTEAKRLFQTIGGEYVILRTEGKISAPPTCVLEDLREDMNAPF